MDNENAPPLTNEELGEIIAAVDAEEEKYAKLRFLTTAQMPCIECGGQGSVPGGVLGDFCPRCGGTRFVEQPDAAPPFEMPDFDGMRRGLKAYCEAFDDRLLPDGHPAKKGLALPARSTIPSMDDLRGLGARFKELKATLREVPRPQLPAPRTRRDEGVLGQSEDESDDFTDAELDDMETDNG